MNTGVQWGGSPTWEFSKQGDMIGEQDLIIERTALTVATAGARPVIRFVDFAGYVAVNRMEITYAANHLQWIYPEGLYLRYRKRMSREAQLSTAQCIMADYTPLARQRRSEQVDRWVISIPTFHSRKVNGFLPIVTLAGKIRWELTLETLANCVQTDGTGAQTCTINTLLVRTNYYHLIARDRKKIIDMSKRPEGITYLVTEIQRHKRETIAANPTSPSTLQLTNIKGPVIALHWFMRAQTNVTGTQSSIIPDYFDSQGGRQWNQAVTAGKFFSCHYFDIQSQGNYVFRAMENDYNRWKYHARYYPSPAGDNIFTVNFSLDPTDEQSSLGTVNFSQLDSAKLNIYWNTLFTAPTAAQYLDVLAEVFNYINLQGGDILVLFR